MGFKSIGNSVSKGCHAVISGTKQHAPEILVTVGIVAGVGAVVSGDVLEGQIDGVGSVRTTIL